MPPLLFEEPKGGPLAEKRARERREPRQDRTLNALKIGTLAVLAVLLVGVVLLVTLGGGDDGADQSSPSVPTIDSTDDGSAAPAPTTSRPQVALGNAATTVLVVTTTPPPPPPQQPTTQPTDPGNGYAVIGQPCPTTGEFSITEDGEFVQCRGDGAGQGFWRPLR